MALNIRLTGTKEEIDKSIEQIKQVMNVSVISDYYRHSSKEETFRIYIDVYLNTSATDQALASVLMNLISS